MTALTPASMALDWMATAPLEELVASPHFFGLTTASNVQRAFCRTVDGLPMGELWHDDAVKRAFDGVEPPVGAPREVSWLSAIRTAKSLIGAAMCVRMSQRCDLSQLGPGEVARVPVLSVDKDKAQAVLNHLIGRVMASPLLKMLVIGKPTAEGLTLRHPSGRPVQAMVVAGKRAGSAVVAYWLAAVEFDEYPRMHGSDDAVVNWDDTRAAARGRILPGGCILNIGSPWAPEGPAYTQVTTHFGKPTTDLVVLRSNGADTNPSWWTPARVEEDARTNPNHRTDCLAEFATPEEALLSSAGVDGAVRAAPERLPFVPGADYSAAMDPATRGNGWTLVLVTRDGRKLRIALALEWIGTRDVPLDPGVVLDEVKEALAPYGVTSVATDQHMGDALARLARDRGLSLYQPPYNEAKVPRPPHALGDGRGRDTGREEPADGHDSASQARHADGHEHRAPEDERRAALRFRARDDARDGAVPRGREGRARGRETRSKGDARGDAQALWTKRRGRLRWPFQARRGGTRSGASRAPRSRRTSA